MLSFISGLFSLTCFQNNSYSSFQFGSRIILSCTPGLVQFPLCFCPIQIILYHCSYCIILKVCLQVFLTFQSIWNPIPQCRIRIYLSFMSSSYGNITQSTQIFRSQTSQVQILNWSFVTLKLVTELPESDVVHSCDPWQSRMSVEVLHVSFRKAKNNNNTVLLRYM